ncbi:acetyl-CoA synthetase-like protein [Corynespora cassiicola Philippines]|uniref:Acetyl-CoA synthetase-like protein n=1 Tax=Corynespora cassiicola Philippines TaxID=1448308 RepID=A0A2T2NIY0_CORCC|nr:acetyl-CoA synthetase-like protein [Corynespora cassiicola Philippines]
MEAPAVSVFRELANLSAEDQVAVSRFGRGPSVPVPHGTAHGAFEHIVDTHPSAIAARFRDESIAYSDLDASANRLANHLIELGLQPQQRVCLVVSRSIDMLVGIFAILKAGCQYVPVDGGVASDQALQHILGNTGAQFAVCLPKFEEKVRRLADKDISIVRLGSEAQAMCSQQRPRVPVSPKDGVYAIYTSGSTGTPKGVDVSHGNVTNALLLEPARLGIRVGSKVAQVLNIAFDMGAWEILACLMNGGTLHLRGANWSETLKEVDTLISTPSILSKYRRGDYLNIKTVVTGGEPCPQALADEWADGVVYYNICGPTEITILNSAHRHTPGAPLSIGKPLPNTTAYILDDDENPVPFGSKGSMWVAGAGVSRGYINLPELTSKRYKLDRFTGEGIMFNTGDIVSWREDGSLDMFGRKDDQVKIKGFRVELDGVTATIEKFPGVIRACATMIDGTLQGFYTTATLVDEQDLDRFVRHHLPYYSVPEQWNYLATIPLTPNGKVSKSELARVVLRKSKSASSSASTRATTITTKELYSPASPASPASSATSNSEPDLEKGAIVVSANLSDFNVSSTSVDDEEKIESLPDKNGFHGQRWLRHRLFILYRKFFSIVVLANLAAAAIILYRRVKNERPMLADLATATAANLTVAILMRSEPVINLLFTTFCSVPTWMPLAIRRHCARVFHIGGIHSGCALSAIMWFTIFTVGASVDFAKLPELRCISIATIVLSYLILLIFIAMASLSHPNIRAKHHDIWEMTHRFGGWTSLILIWTQTFIATKDLNPDTDPRKAWLHSPPIWLLTVASMAIIFPWLHLRKVPVRSEVLSGHAVRLWFDYTTPVVGTSVRLAERPLVDWHGFATITNANGKGFSLVVSNAGDFTKRTINRAPTHIWVRGIPGCGVLRIATLFKSVVLVATGSGIGPCLAVILAKKVPCRILWTAPNPEQTFGQEIVDSVRETDPKAVIWNTRTQGKPNMPLLTWQLYKEMGAEAVCVISNKRFTSQVVYAMETRGVPAYGAIFDS